MPARLAAMEGSADTSAGATSHQTPDGGRKVWGSVGTTITHRSPRHRGRQRAASRSSSGVLADERPSAQAGRDRSQVKLEVIALERAFTDRPDAASQLVAEVVAGDVHLQTANDLEAVVVGDDDRDLEAFLSRGRQLGLGAIRKAPSPTSAITSPSGLAKRTPSVAGTSYPMHEKPNSR